MKISVFGNPDLKEDNAGIKLIPWLKKKYPEAEIKIEDPAGGLEPAEDWLIVDACEGINKITIFKDLDQFEAARRVSVHDYEVITELKLLKKLGKIKKLKILAVPQNFSENYSQTGSP
jgi:Ni,Fe-hydrogenase maturation factor